MRYNWREDLYRRKEHTCCRQGDTLKMHACRLGRACGITQAFKSECTCRLRNHVHTTQSHPRNHTHAITLRNHTHAHNYAITPTPTLRNHTNMQATCNKRSGMHACSTTKRVCMRMYARTYKCVPTGAGHKPTPLGCPGTQSAARTAEYRHFDPAPPPGPTERRRGCQTCPRSAGWWVPRWEQRLAC